MFIVFFILFLYFIHLYILNNKCIQCSRLLCFKTRKSYFKISIKPFFQISRKPFIQISRKPSKGFSNFKHPRNPQKGSNTDHSGKPFFLTVWDERYPSKLYNKYNTTNKIYIHT